MVYLTGIVFVIPSNDPLVLPGLCIVSIYVASNFTFYTTNACIMLYYTSLAFCAASSLVAFYRVFLWIWNQYGKAVESLPHIQVPYLHIYVIMFIESFIGNLRQLKQSMASKIGI